jgi:hypothetical protein
MLAECGHEHVQATGVDHADDGATGTVPSGVVTFTISNEGEELHELGTARISDDATPSLGELLALPENEIWPSVD